MQNRCYFSPMALDLILGPKCYFTQILEYQVLPKPSTVLKTVNRRTFNNYAQDLKILKGIFSTLCSLIDKKKPLHCAVL